jgi:hypothetical protein
VRLLIHQAELGARGLRAARDGWKDSFPKRRVRVPPTSRDGALVGRGLAPTRSAAAVCACASGHGVRSSAGEAGGPVEGDRCRPAAACDGPFNGVDQQCAAGEIPCASRDRRGAARALDDERLARSAIHRTDCSGMKTVLSDVSSKGAMLCNTRNTLFITDTIIPRKGRHYCLHRRRDQGLVPPSCAVLLFTVWANFSRSPFTRRSSARRLRRPHDPAHQQSSKVTPPATNRHTPVIENGKLSLFY